MAIRAESINISRRHHIYSRKMVCPGSRSERLPFAKRTPFASPGVQVVEQVQALRKADLPPFPTQARMIFTKFYPKQGQFRSNAEVFAWLGKQGYSFPETFDKTQWQFLLSKSEDRTGKRPECPLLMTTKNVVLEGTDPASLAAARLQLETPAIFWRPPDAPVVMFPKSLSFPHFPIAPTGVDILR